MDNLGSQLSAYIEFPIDFEGQKKVDCLIFYSVYGTGLLSVLVGASTGNLNILLLTFATCLVAILLAVLPPWPQYTRNPVQWLKVKYDF